MPSIWQTPKRLTSIGGDYAHSLARAQQQGLRQRARPTQQRLHMLAGVVAIGFGVLGLRFAGLSLLPPDIAGIQPSLAQYQLRPKILDRRGETLAIQIMTRQLAARPNAILHPAKAAAGLKAIFPTLDEADLLDRFLVARSRYFVIRHDVSPQEEAAILRLGEPGLALEERPRRVYPNGAMAGHVVGFVNRDLAGLAGLEYALDNSAQLRADIGAAGMLVSTLDLRIQHIVRAALTAGMTTYRAQAGVGLLMDSQNGEILAMVSLPDFDPNMAHLAGADARFNRASLGVYEMGSIFKLYTAAMVLEQGHVKLSERFDVSKPLRVGGHWITDMHQIKDSLNLEEIIAHSSNIGTVQLALGMGANTHWQYLTRFGFTRRPESAIPELAPPILPEQWEDLTRATVSFGHGIAISPLQAVMAVGALINGGTLYQPRFYLGEATRAQRILSPNTSKHMRAIMRSVVAYGTARMAERSDYKLIGKTGTAEKPGRAGYDEDRLLVSFVSAFPGHAPRYVLLVMLDEPKGIDATYGFAGAGWNVTPISRAIIGRVAPLLGLTPDPPIPEASEEPAHATGRIAG